MDESVRIAERNFQQQRTIVSLYQMMQAKLRAGLYENAKKLRADNRLYRKLLAEDLVALIHHPNRPGTEPVKGLDFTTCTGKVGNHETWEFLANIPWYQPPRQPPNGNWDSILFNVDIDSNTGEVTSVQLLLPETITYDLNVPPDGRILLTVYGLSGGALREDYEPGQAPFKDGLDMCKHMVLTWAGKHFNNEINWY